MKTKGSLSNWFTGSPVGCLVQPVLVFFFGCAHLIRFFVHLRQFNIDTEKMMVGRLLSYLEGNFSGAICLRSGGVYRHVFCFDKPLSEWPNDGLSAWCFTQNGTA